MPATRKNASRGWRRIWRNIRPPATNFSSFRVPPFAIDFGGFWGDGPVRSDRLLVPRSHTPFSPRSICNMLAFHPPSIGRRSGRKITQPLQPLPSDQPVRSRGTSRQDSTKKRTHENRMSSCGRLSEMYPRIPFAIPRNGREETESSTLMPMP